MSRYDCYYNHYFYWQQGPRLEHPGARSMEGKCHNINQLKAFNVTYRFSKGIQLSVSPLSNTGCEKSRSTSTARHGAHITAPEAWKRWGIFIM